VILPKYQAWRAHAQQIESVAPCEPLLTFS
jgi:hypothetical protein